MTRQDLAAAEPVDANGSHPAGFCFRDLAELQLRLLRHLGASLVQDASNRRTPGMVVSAIGYTASLEFSFDHLRGASQSAAGVHENFAFRGKAGQPNSIYYVLSEYARKVRAKCFIIVKIRYTALRELLSLELA